MTDVERDTTRRNTIKIKQFDKDFGRSSSLSKRSSNGSDKAYTNRQNLGRHSHNAEDPMQMGQLFTGKFDATSKKPSQKNLNLNIEFPIKNVSATQSN